MSYVALGEIVKPKFGTPVVPPGPVPPVCNKPRVKCAWMSPCKGDFCSCAMLGQEFKGWTMTSAGWCIQCPTRFFYQDGSCIPLASQAKLPPPKPPPSPEDTWVNPETGETLGQQMRRARNRLLIGGALVLGGVGIWLATRKKGAR
jgi:hypothetical protein